MSDIWSAKSEIRSSKEGSYSIVPETKHPFYYELQHKHVKIWALKFKENNVRDAGDASGLLKLVKFHLQGANLLNTFKIF